MQTAIQNVHPMFVHFPIALFTIYAIFEIARFPFLTRQVWYTQVKIALLYLGFLSSFITLQTGESAAHTIDKNFKPLVHIHSNFASESVAIFGILAGAYFVSWLLAKPEFSVYFAKMPTFSKLLSKLVNFIVKVSPILSILGLIAITITAALGGAIVYGPHVDPIVSFVYGLFFKQ